MGLKLKPSYEARLLEEIDFWRRFIEDWKREHGGAVHPRMQEARLEAESRLRRHRETARTVRITGTGYRTKRSLH